MNDYQSLEALLHDPFWAAEGEAVELGFMENVLKEHPGRSLEIGCGSGRLLLPLLQKGFEVEGLELSEEMLRLCKEAAATLNLVPVLHHGDMTAFVPEERYDSVLVPAFTLQLSEDAVATLRAFHWQLKEGGVLYLSVFRPQAELLKELPENEWYDDHGIELADGRKASLRTRHRLDRKQRILFREHHYTLEGQEGVQEHRSEQTVRWFTPRQLSGMLMKTGFEVLNAMADFDPELPVDDDSQIVTLLARRAG
ncbi:MAG: SAM-dependent methyltransferase [Akkermansiaceae bacterium]|nr:SAM-dependent methyltransferase [Akkermansiaceae bacterium]